MTMFHLSPLHGDGDFFIPVGIWRRITYWPLKHGGYPRGKYEWSLLGTFYDWNMIQGWILPNNGLKHPFSSLFSEVIMLFLGPQQSIQVQAPVSSAADESSWEHSRPSSR